MNNVFQDSGVPTAFQFMPPGVSIITAHVNGKAGTREVHVDASTAERLQRDLEEKLAAAAAGQKARPCGLFDHKDGKASLLPKRFYWKDGEGVMLECDWTAAGKAAVSGRDYSYWSPCFRLNNGEVVGLASGVEVGSLVNNPAFETIARIAASRPRVDAPDDEGEVEVNGGAVEVDAAHCNQHEHVPGCENSGGADDGKRDYAVGAAKKKLISATQEHQKALDEYNAAMNSGEADKEKIVELENALVDTYSKYSRARVALLKAYKKYSKTFDADMDEYEKLCKLNYHSEGVKSSKPEGAEPEDHIAKMGLAELRAELGKRHATPVVERIKARIAELEKREDEGAEPEEKKELSPLKRAQLAALEKEKKRRARKDAKDAGMQDALERVRLAAAGCKCKPGMERVKECVKAANPYGCNQFGHGFKVEHKGYGAGGQKTLKLEGTDKAHQEARKILQERAASVGSLEKETKRLESEFNHKLDAYNRAWYALEGDPTVHPNWEYPKDEKERARFVKQERVAKKEARQAQEKLRQARQRLIEKYRQAGRNDDADALKRRIDEDAKGHDTLRDNE